MLCVSRFSTASRALIFMKSIQFSISSSSLAVLSASSSDEFWSRFVGCLLLEYPHLSRRHECLFPKTFLFVFSFCLDDDSEHFSLDSAKHLFVFFGDSACSDIVRD